MSEWEYQQGSKRQSLAYRDLYQTNKQIILLLHGLGVDSKSWLFQEKALGEAGYRPIVPDLPGFGASTTNVRIWSIEECARILYQFSLEISHTPIVLVGISLGGAIALKMMANNSERYSKAVLINSFSKIRPEKINNALFLITRV